MIETPTSHGSLLLIGVNHTTAPIEVRERLAISAARLADATRTLAHQPGIREAMILSTCNRVEFLIDAENAGDVLATHAPSFLPRFVHEYFSVAPSSLEPHLYTFREREAVRHLFRVASSLDSMVVGEPQILGQVKTSWNVAREVGAITSNERIASTLDPLLQRAFSVAKRVRSETQIGSSSVSIASVAVDLARKIFGSLTGKTVLIVGAGKMADLAARHLIQQGATTLLVSNRTEARAQKIADALRTPHITTGVIPLDHLHAEAHRADIIITSTGAGAEAGEHIFTRSQAAHLVQRRRNRPIFFVDIAVPRDVDPTVNKVEGCFVYDIDDLQQVAAQNQASRSKEAEAAETIVSSEVERYHQRRSAAPAVEAIKQLQLSAETLRQQELHRTAARLAAEPFSPAQQAAVDALTKSLTAKLLHPQLTLLRESSNTPKDE